ncbi:MBL fold metallo-hydrolase [Chitinasiproducens palmae]|uniref:L-ascorbate metabolism protein UlaG, beta-lactamase superfamily n=1 Tax=Chitinasiproducens palmae TaxID=1770053 RepID=A0A1H2PU12_9BURK|nr:MBL fold metallo-hydrolase [Chitinasiproducens palmae]SDV50644.1 L-ascorbate metabolism protein UlaG, beta-lactamase superfamily [Chitinasiproducens palmae]
MGACLSFCRRTDRAGARRADSPQFDGRRFRNRTARPSLGATGFARLLWDFMFHKSAMSVPKTALQIMRLTRADLIAAPERSLFRLGHSTVLLKLRSGFWITDPVFAERASPFRSMGPRRFHAPPISLDELPPLKGVILSHDHYDHLDRDAVAALAGKTDVFLAPLGVGDRLLAWGVPPAKVRQFDWWQQTEIEGLRLALTPSQHFSGRGVLDGDTTLWASWVLIEPPGPSGESEFRLFFSGDSGYFEGFKEIGRRFGPFDVTLVENGAYNERWRFVHMVPEETLQAHLDLRGRRLMPIHNGTFDLAMHAWNEPLERITALAAEHGVSLLTPRIGERVDLSEPAATLPWWRNDETTQAAPGSVGTRADRPQTR